MRAAVFIDGGYMINQLKTMRLQADYAKMADYFLAPLRKQYPMDLLRCYFYYCPPFISGEPTDDELRRQEAHLEFEKEIEGLERWALRLGKLHKRWDGQKEIYEQKRVDVLLSVDLVRHAAAGHIQHAILVAGDSDFIPAVDAVKESGVTLSLWCGASNTVHNDLMARADTVFNFDWNRFPQVKMTDTSRPNRTSNQDSDKRESPKPTAPAQQKSVQSKNQRRRKKQPAPAAQDTVEPTEAAPPQKRRRRPRRRPSQKSSENQNQNQQGREREAESSQQAESPPEKSKWTQRLRKLIDS